MLQSNYMMFYNSIMERYGGMVSRINPLALVFLQAQEAPEEAVPVRNVTNIHKIFCQTNQFIYNTIVNRYTRNYQDSLQLVKQNALYSSSPNFKINSIHPIACEYRKNGVPEENQDAVRQMVERIVREFRQREERETVSERSAVLKKSLMEVLKSFSRPLSEGENIQQIAELLIKQEASGNLREQKRLEQTVRQVWSEAVRRSVRDEAENAELVGRIVSEIGHGHQEEVTEVILGRYISHLLGTTEKILSRENITEKSLTGQTKLQETIRQVIKNRMSSPSLQMEQEGNWKEIQKKLEKEIKEYWHTENEKKREHIKYIAESQLIPFAEAASRGTSRAVIRQEIHKLLQKDEAADRLAEQICGMDRKAEGAEYTEYNVTLLSSAETLLQKVLLHTDTYKKGKTQYERQVISRMTPLPISPMTLSFRPYERGQMEQEGRAYGHQPEEPVIQRRVVQIIKQQNDTQKKYYTNLIQRFLSRSEEEKQPVIDRSELPAGIIFHKKPRETVQFVSQDIVQLYPLEMNYNIHTGVVTNTHMANIEGGYTDSPHGNESRGSSMQHDSGSSLPHHTTVISSAYHTDAAAVSHPAEGSTVIHNTSLSYGDSVIDYSHSPDSRAEEYHQDVHHQDVHHQDVHHRDIRHTGKAGRGEGSTDQDSPAGPGSTGHEGSAIIHNSSAIAHGSSAIIHGSSSENAGGSASSRVHPPDRVAVSPPAEGGSLSPLTEGGSLSYPAEGGMVRPLAEGGSLSYPAEGSTVSPSTGLGYGDSVVDYSHHPDSRQEQYHTDIHHTNIIVQGSGTHSGRDSGSTYSGRDSGSTYSGRDSGTHSGQGGSTHSVQGSSTHSGRGSGTYGGRDSGTHSGQGGSTHSVQGGSTHSGRGSGTYTGRDSAAYSGRDRGTGKDGGSAVSPPAEGAALRHSAGPGYGDSVVDYSHHPDSRLGQTHTDIHHTSITNITHVTKQNQDSIGITHPGYGDSVVDYSRHPGSRPEQQGDTHPAGVMDRGGSRANGSSTVQGSSGAGQGSGTHAHEGSGTHAHEGSGTHAHEGSGTHAHEGSAAKQRTGSGGGSIQSSGGSMQSSGGSMQSSGGSTVSPPAEGRAVSYSTSLSYGDSVVDYSIHPGSNMHIYHTHQTAAADQSPGSTAVHTAAGTSGTAAGRGSSTEKGGSMRGSSGRDGADSSALPHTGTGFPRQELVYPQKESLPERRQQILQRIERQIEQRLQKGLERQAGQEKGEPSERQPGYQPVPGTELRAEKAVELQLLQRLESRTEGTGEPYAKHLIHREIPDFTRKGRGFLAATARQLPGVLLEISPVPRQMPVSLVYKQDGAGEPEAGKEDRPREKTEFFEDIVFEKQVVHTSTETREVTEQGSETSRRQTQMGRGGKEAGVERLVSETISRQMEKSIEQISRKVYRNIENQLKKERERRGM